MGFILDVSRGTRYRNPMKIEDQPLTQQAVHDLLEHVRMNDLQPGDTLPNETVLSESLGVSRNILREAAGHLKGIGILESKRGSGVRLRAFNPMESFSEIMKLMVDLPSMGIPELLAMRRVLELGSIDTAVKCATANDLRAIEDAASECETHVESNAHDATTYKLLDLKFHHAITKPAGLPMLESLNDVLVAFFQRKGDHEEWAPETLRESAREHRMIAHAFSTRQPAVALICLHNHFKHYDDWTGE